MDYIDFKVGDIVKIYRDESHMITYMSEDGDELELSKCSDNGVYVNTDKTQIFSRSKLTSRILVDKNAIHIKHVWRLRFKKLLIRELMTIPMIIIIYCALAFMYIELFVW